MLSNVKFYTNNFMEGNETVKTASAIGLQDISFPSSGGGERGCSKINLL
jgi:hypothetical protein